jgi:hypothetical protein
MDEFKLRVLLNGMIALLKIYETELAAYREVYRLVENEAQRAGIDLNISNALETLAQNSSLKKEVDEMYADCGSLVRALNPDSLDRALNVIDQIQKLRGVKTADIQNPPAQ